MPTEKVRGYYDAFSKGYDEFYEQIQSEKIQHLLTKLHNISHPIDIGAGTGIFSTLIQCPVISLDLSVEMLRVGLSKNRNILAIVGSATHLPMRRLSADTVVSFTVLHNIDEPSKSRDEMIRIASNNFVGAITILRKSKKALDIIALYETRTTVVSVFDVPPEDIGLIFKL